MAMTTTPEREKLEAWLDHFEKRLNEYGAWVLTGCPVEDVYDTYPGDLYDAACHQLGFMRQMIAAARQSAPESCRKVDDCTESLCMQANRCKHTLPPQPQRLCVEQSAPEDTRERFEAYCKVDGLPIGRHGNLYDAIGTALAWAAWKAAEVSTARKCARICTDQVGWASTYDCAQAIEDKFLQEDT